MASPPQDGREHWGYCRVSSEEQLQGVSIDSQFRRLHDAGIPEDQILVEVGSATKGRTPELQRLFRLGRDGKIASILAIRQDRFQRNRQTAAAMWELIDVHKVAFRFLDQPDIDPADPTSVLQAQILGAFAQFETEQLSQRVKNGLTQNRQMKKHHGRPPNGYLNADGHLVPHPEEWGIYKKVIRCYLDTGSSTAARKLRYELTGKAWGVSSFARWIQSPAIRGYVCWGASKGDLELFPGQHEALMTPAEWDQVQAVRQSNRKNTGAFRKGAKPSIGSGLFTCADCGRTLLARQNAAHRRKLYQCVTAVGGGCSQGHKNYVYQDQTADILRKAIFVAAVQIAEQVTPSELPEPKELIALRVEREEYVAKDTARADRMVQEIDNEIAVMLQQLKLDGPKRAQAVAEEIGRLRDPKRLNALTDDELRSFAKRYGLALTVDHKRVVGGEWKRLGPIFNLVAGFAWGGDLDQMVEAITNAKGEPISLDELKKQMAALKG